MVSVSSIEERSISLVAVGSEPTRAVTQLSVAPARTRLQWLPFWLALSLSNAHLPYITHGSPLTPSPG
ncbi:hypothetical protein SK128_006356, partial [Halocaridina rubra]